MSRPSKITYEKKLECAERLRTLLMDGKWHKWREVRLKLGFGQVYVRGTPLYEEELVSCTDHNEGGLKLYIFCSQEEITHFYRSMRSRSNEVMRRAIQVTYTWSKAFNYPLEEEEEEGEE